GARRSPGGWGRCVQAFFCDARSPIPCVSPFASSEWRGPSTVSRKTALAYALHGRAAMARVNLSATSRSMALALALAALDGSRPLAQLEAFEPAAGPSFLARSETESSPS